MNDDTAETASDRIGELEERLDERDSAIRDYRSALAAAHAERDDYAARLKTVDESWARLAVERDHAREAAGSERRRVIVLEGELAKVRNGAEVLGSTVEHMARGLYAAWVDIARGDMPAVRERILNTLPPDPGMDMEPGEQWDGKETGDVWFWRTREDPPQEPFGPYADRAGRDGENQ